jgi:glutamyl-tRNA synthetase (EC 6.1.1.17)
MEEFSEDRVAAAAERAALINALQHEAEAAVGPIMGPLMAEHPSFRAHADAVSRIVADAVAAVNAESMTWRRERLAAIDADALAAIDAPEPTAASHTLPALPEVDGAVRMRAAPNPNGPWHIGHARMPAVIGAYRDRYDGHFILRFDDTDPGTKRPDLGAYAAIEADLAYLGVPPDEVVRASDRMEMYYAHAEELIDAGVRTSAAAPRRRSRRSRTPVRRAHTARSRRPRRTSGSVRWSTARSGRGRPSCASAPTSSMRTPRSVTSWPSE